MANVGPLQTGFGLAVCWMGLWGAGWSRAGPSQVETIRPDVLQVRDDAGQWGGPSLGITHQRGPDYQAKKILDLSAVPESAWESTNEVRLSAYFCVRDYSWHDAPQPNGLDEAFQIVVNGHALLVPTNSGVPVYVENQPMPQFMRWHEFGVPKDWVVRGRNEVVFAMVAPEGKKPDDYLYLGIDNGVPGGNSQVRFGRSDTWRTDQLNVPGAKGEYMVRLYLLAGPRDVSVVWHPDAGRLEDPAGLIVYAGSHGQQSRMEWAPQGLDPLTPVRVEVEIAEARSFKLSWLAAGGEALGPPVELLGPKAAAELAAPLATVPSGIALDRAVRVRTIVLRAGRGYHALPRRVDMAPIIAAPAGQTVQRPVRCQLSADAVTLENLVLRCRFARRDGRLCLESLYHELAAAEVLRHAGDCWLFLVEADGRRWAGAKDFTCKSLAPLAERPGFSAVLFCEPIQLEAVLTAEIREQDLRLGLTLTPQGSSPLDFKVAFPHLAGFALSDDLADDYYFFPWGGGIISDQPAVIRRGYGDNEAIYQVMDLFSPKRGAGLAIWCADRDGRHKVLALRKHVPGQPELNGDAAHTPTIDEVKWHGSLESVPGIGLTYEYLRRTRRPQEAFAPHEAVLRAHAGDWHAAMQAYADWCRSVWKFRPYPSRLDRVVNMLAAGWGQSPLFRAGQYRTDFLRPGCDCIELMSWWEWSPLGPWRTPIDQMAQRLGPETARMWEPYLVLDPVTGQRMFTNGPGDYDGYNERFGGLPAFRQAIQTYRERGALVTLYTDPLRVDDNTKLGQTWGRTWCIVQADGKPRTHYDAWNPCLDVAEYRRWVAQTMARVLRETGADGLRLDEYGHAGSACFSTLHAHTFAEPGTTEWQRAVAESTRLVRQAMDEIDARLVLATEHPGYDFLMQFIEGCITYDLTVQATPLRPLECNLQRFYFPECKCYELDHRGADPKHRKRFFNAVGSFGSYYPADMDTVLRENRDAFSSRQCEALVPTIPRLIYAHRFRAPEKTVYTLYNASGHSYDGDVLRVELPGDWHVADVLRAEQPECRREGDALVVRTYLAPNEVTCLACLPARVSASHEDNGLEIAVAEPRATLELRLCDARGQVLWQGPAGNRRTRIDLNAVAADKGKPVCVKLLDGDRLVDLVRLTELGPRPE